MKDKTKLLHERALITCVIMLFLCIILKLFGFQWFDLDTDIPILNEIDKIVMSNYWLCLLYSSILLSINTYFIVLITLNISLKEHLKIYLYIFVISLFYVSIKVFLLDYIIMITDTLYPLIFILFTNKTFNLKILGKYLLVFVLNILYQGCSIYIRNISIQQGNYGFISSTLLMIDYYMMLIITYIYQIKGGFKNA